MRTEAMGSGLVFVSYCRDNLQEASRLREDLTQAGFSVWWDQDILGGQDWKQAIDTAMEKCRAVVVCFSKEVSDRDRSGIYPELANAVEKYRSLKPGQTFILPIRFSECEIPYIKFDATRRLADIQYIDLFPDWEVGMARLIASLVHSGCEREVPDSVNGKLCVQGTQRIARDQTPNDPILAGKVVLKSLFSESPKAKGDRLKYANWQVYVDDEYVGELDPGKRPFECDLAPGRYRVKIGCDEINIKSGSLLVQVETGLTTNVQANPEYAILHDQYRINLVWTQ